MGEPRPLSHQKLNIGIAAALLWLTLIELGSSSRSVRAEKGLIDLGGPSSQRATAELSGEWEFYWNRLLSPEAFDTNPSLKPDAYLSLPANWTRLQIAGRRISKLGDATLRLRVRHPWKGQEVGLKLRKINNSFKLFADSTLIAESGALSNSLGGFRGQYRPQSVYFRPDSDETVFTLQVSNRIPGAWSGVVEEIDVGPRSTIETLTNDLLISDAFSIGGRALILVLFLAAFLLLKSPSSLIFSLYTLDMIIRLSMVREMLLLRIFPAIAIDLFMRLFLLSSLLYGPLLLFSIWAFLGEHEAPSIQRSPSAPSEWRSFWRRGVAEKLILVVVALSIVEIAFFVFGGAGFYIEYFEVFVPILPLCLIFCGALIVAHVRRERRHYGLGGVFIVVLYFIVLESLISLRILTQNYVYPFFFLGSIPAVSRLATFSIQQGMLSYLSIACLSFYFLYHIVVRHLSRPPIAPVHRPPVPSFEEIARIYKISDRELEVLSMAVKGLSYEEIGEKCFISKNTVKAHLGSIYRKLGVKNKTELANKIGRAH